MAANISENRWSGFSLFQMVSKRGIFEFKETLGTENLRDKMSTVRPGLEASKWRHDWTRKIPTWETQGPKFIDYLIFFSNGNFNFDS